MLATGHDAAPGFMYSALKPGEIRLVHVSNDGVLRCELKHVMLHEAAYDALSYCWGAPSDCEIVADGMTVTVRENLFLFMQQLEPGWYWADALCINQADNAERSQQVGVMHQIFSQAKRVLAWLGPEHHDSGLTFKALGQPEIEWDVDVLYGVAHLCHRSYWSRLWVFQELALARELVLMCGAGRLRWADVERIPLSAEQLKGQYSMSEVKLCEEYDYERMLSSPAFALLQSVKQRAADLWGLIMQTKGLKCVDAHDKVYGLLAVAEDDLEVDYTRPIHEVLNKVLKGHHKRVPPRNFQQIEGNLEQLVAAVLGPQAVPGAHKLIFKDVPKTPLTKRVRTEPAYSDLSLWWALKYDHREVEDLLFEKKILSNSTMSLVLEYMPEFHTDPAFVTLLLPALSRMPARWLWAILTVDDKLNQDTLWVFDLIDGSTAGRGLSFLRYVCTVSGVAPRAQFAVLEKLLGSKVFGGDPAEVNSVLETLVRAGESKKSILLLKHWAPALTASFSVHPPEQSSNEDVSLLHLAAHWKNTEVLAYLLEKVDVNVKTSEMRTALHHAMLGSHNDRDLTVMVLLEAGIDVTVRDVHGKTALHLAIGQSLMDSIKMLLEAGAVEDGRDEKAAIELAKRLEREDIARMIRGGRTRKWWPKA